MTKDEQKQFIDVFTENVKEICLSKADKIPKHWDGWQIRHWIFLKFRSENLLEDRRQFSRYRKLKAQCENEIFVNNL